MRPTDQVSAETALDSGHTNSDQVIGYYRKTSESFERSQFVPAGRGGDVKEIRTRLTNFTAEIIQELAVDDGAGEMLTYAVDVTFEGERKTIVLTASEFSAMKWPHERCWARAIIFPGFMAEDHAKTAIQIFSRNSERRRIYSHLGWVMHKGQAMFISSGQAISDLTVFTNPTATNPTAVVPNTVEENKAISVECRVCQVSHVDIDLPVELRLYQLPQTPENDRLRESIAASLRFISSAPNRITYPIFSLLWLAPLGGPQHSIHLWGSPQCRKSSLVAVGLQHFGPKFEANRFPASWSSTENALEFIANAAKDVVLGIDDFRFSSASEGVQQQRKADRLIRSNRNRSSRQRMCGGGGIRTSKPPQCSLLSTGEEPFRGVSLNARHIGIELEQRDVDLTILTRLQSDGRLGLLAEAMAAYITWLTQRRSQLVEQLQSRLSQLRDQAAQELSGSTQTGEIIADLSGAFSYFTAFAVEVGAITKEVQNQLLAENWKALIDAGKRHVGLMNESNPVERFKVLVEGALMTGRAHFSDKDGNEPSEGLVWGWRENRPMGERIGWVADDGIYLDMTAIYRTAQLMAGNGIAEIGVSPTMLAKALKREGWLVRTDEKREVLTVRRRFGGSTRNVHHLKREFIIDKSPEEPSSFGQMHANPNGDQLIWVKVPVMLICREQEGHLWTKDKVLPEDDPKIRCNNSWEMQAGETVLVKIGDKLLHVTPRIGDDDAPYLDCELAQRTDCVEDPGQDLYRLINEIP